MERRYCRADRAGWCGRDLPRPPPPTTLLPPGTIASRRRRSRAFAPDRVIRVTPQCTTRAMLVRDPLLARRRGGYGIGMPETARSWTREMVLALPDDGNRYELFDGVLLVTPAPRPRHQEAVRTLLERLFDYLGGSTIGRAN